jgi:hypothetical protein
MTQFRRVLCALSAIVCAVTLAPAASAAVDDPRAPTIDRQVWRDYWNAIIDSTVATPGEVVHDLLVPSPADPRTTWQTVNGEDYLLVSVMGYKAVASVAAGEAFTLSGDKWVAVPGQVQQECARLQCEHMNVRKLDLQLKQLLGLPPDADYRYISSFWVRPADIFRPCTDPRVASPSCPETVATATPDAPIPTTLGQVTLADFLWTQTNYAWRLPDVLRPAHSVSCAFDFANTSAGQCLGFPWTRLGYTYDWTPGVADHEGITEFVVPKGTSAILEGVGSQRQAFPFVRPS